MILKHNVVVELKQKIIKTTLNIYSIITLKKNCYFEGNYDEQPINHKKDINGASRFKIEERNI